MDQELRIEEKYLYLFNSPIGQEVLGDILFRCHFGSALNNEVEMNEYNVGIYILGKIGMANKQTISDVVRAICSVGGLEHGV